MRDAPRCPSCHRYMEVEKRGDRMVTYECCGMTKTLPKEEFEPMMGVAPNDWR